ncbi:MAG: 3-dehydroquinate synthase, partial [Gemmatimonadales bacterium]
MIAELPEILNRWVTADRFAVISDEIVYETHGRSVARALDAVGFVFPRGERHKSRNTWSKLTDELLESGYDRQSCIVAVGGGVTGDVAGFVAATFMRGIAVVHVPTTLLSMVDASVGGKTGVDTPAGKNLVGAFHQPQAVICDVALLETLSEDELRNGLVEAIKHAAIADDAYATVIERRDLVPLVEGSVRIKAAIVTADELDSGRRAILNFGHTIGHALERMSDFELSHGSAVALGMVVEASLGEALGITESGTELRLRELLHDIGAPLDQPSAASGESLLEAMRTDKKSRSRAIRFALLQRFGKAAGRPDNWTFEAPSDDIIR